MEAAEQVLESHKSIAIVDAITSLTDKGLLVAENSDGNQRFRMLVVVREYALERLTESGMASVIAGLHAKYFLALAEKAEPELQSTNVGPWVKRLDLEHDNLRAVIKWSMVADPEIAARVAKAIRLFWMLRGYTREAQYWYREILRASTVPGQYRWILLTGLANMTQFRGDVAAAEETYRESLVESRILDDPKCVAQSLRGVAGAVYMRGDTAAAKELIDEALSLSRCNDDAFGEAAALARLGDIALKEGDASEARLRGEQALEIFRRVGFQPGISSKLMNLGMAEVADGAFESATEHLGESLQIAIKAGDYITTRLALEGFCWLFFEAGDHFNAARLAAAAFRMGDEIDHLLEPAETRMRELYLGRLKEVMGEREFDDAYKRGLEMPRSEAIALALGSDRKSKPELRLVRKTHSPTRGRRTNSS